MIHFLQYSKRYEVMTAATSAAFHIEFNVSVSCKRNEGKIEKKVTSKTKVHKADIFSCHYNVYVCVYYYAIERLLQFSIFLLSLMPIPRATSFHLFVVYVFLRPSYHISHRHNLHSLAISMSNNSSTNVDHTSSADTSHYTLTYRKGKERERVKDIERAISTIERICERFESRLKKAKSVDIDASSNKID